MKLYYHPLSGHSHRARLLLSLLGVDHELIEVDLMKGAHKSAEFLKLNRFGQVPVLVDDATVVADSNAILVYLAGKLNQTDWLPQTPAAEAAIQRWLSVAAGEIAYGPAAARLITVFSAARNAEEVIGRAHSILGIVEQELGGHEFIVG
ncbi:MAG TPA: glutathione S-transferase, partial [Paraburkholderia sp.]|nr:glutathione S-transferase [Paraburkholderia sp.]